jgi:hypothetical protein
MNLKTLTVRELFDQLVNLLKKSTRPDPAGDAIRAVKAEEDAKKGAN